MSTTTMRVAAIDCGTNSVRLLVADVTATGLRDVARRMQIVRLGEGVDATGAFTAAAIERTRRALADYAAEVAESGAERVRMVATSASRDVSNRADFAAMVRATVHLDAEVISGEEEARLSFAGATWDLPGFAAPWLVLDIGGGSTEFVLGHHAVRGAASIDIGCVRLTERHLRGDPPAAGEIATALAEIRAGIALAAESAQLRQAKTLIGLAGSVTTVAALAIGLPAYDSERIHLSRISYDQVDAVTSMLLAATRDERARLPMMHPGRVDVIGAGALILRTVMEEAQLDSVVASEHDILDGIAHSLTEGF